MSDSFHKKFSEVTITKLQLYKKYLYEWLPVFMNKSTRVNRILIFDLFCGPGKDSEGTYGSPLILIDMILEYKKNPNTINNIPICIFFNDKNKQKIELLKKTINDKYGNIHNVFFYFYNKEFSDIFYELLPAMKMNDAAKLVFIDQFGISALDETKFKLLTEITRLDWILFISSNIVHRFSDHPAIQKYINIENRGNFADIHKIIADYYRKMLPKGKEYFVSQFSLKKKSNIYGLLFGSRNILGAEKFTNVCWKIDPIGGEANYDLPSNAKIPYGQLSLLGSGYKKLDSYEYALEKAIKEGQLQTNIDCYVFSITNGIKACDTKNILKKFKKKGIIKKLPRALSHDAFMKRKVEYLTTN